MSISGQRKPSDVQRIRPLPIAKHAAVAVALGTVAATHAFLGVGLAAEVKTEAARQHGDYIPPLARFHDVLLTTSRREFGNDEDIFRLAVTWQHERLRKAEALAAETAVSSQAPADKGARGNSSTPTTNALHHDGDGIEDGVHSPAASRDGAGWGTFVVFTSHGKARAARQVLVEKLAPASVITLTHSRHQGGCFLVHASASAVDALIDDDSKRGGAATGEKAQMAERGDDSLTSELTLGGVREERPLFEGFSALPPNLKVSRTLFDHHGTSTASKTAGDTVPANDSMIDDSEDDSSQPARADGQEADHSNDTRNRETLANGVDGLSPAQKTGKGTLLSTTEGGSGAETGPPNEQEAWGGGDDVFLSTSPYEAVHEGGLIVFLSPGSVSKGDERVVAERWRRQWASPSLDLRGLSFWSDPQDAAAKRTSATGLTEDVTSLPPLESDAGELRKDESRAQRDQTGTERRAKTGTSRTGRDGGLSGVVESTVSDVRGSAPGMLADSEAIGAATLVREWEGAARVVHLLADREGSTPARVCGWDRVRVIAEAPGLMTVRDIGHLLDGASEADAVDSHRTTTAPPSGSPLSGRERTSCLMGLVSFLASRAEAARVSPLPRAELFNAVASRVVQSASETGTPLWDRGVDGSGQVIQMVDSGLQEGSCYFADGTGSSDGVEHGYLLDEDGTLGSGDYTYDLTQRKVVQYIEGTRGGDSYMADDALGHGSHVAGSAAGSIFADWEGPADCPLDASSDVETALSCVGKCLDPSVLEAMPEDSTFSLDAWCPEYDCDTYWPQYCLSDDRTETLQEASGVAPGALIAVLDLGGSEGLQQVLGGYMWEASAGAGARLHSGSWGFPDDPCTVDDASISFDTWAYENPEHLLIFAAGNLGDDMTGCSIASPAVGKNCLAVGSSMSGLSRLSKGDMDDVSDFSSIGPTADGRIKPDVLAPGHFVFSASNGGDGSCELELNSGTSMSCPIAAGAGAIVRQYFADGFYVADVEARGLCGTPMSTAAAGSSSAGSAGGSGAVEFACSAFDPTGALVKAVMIHGANSMGGSTDPDGERGFGRIHLEASFPFEGEDVSALYAEDTKSTGGDGGTIVALAVEERTFQVTEADAELARDLEDGVGGGLRATLVWMDPPATALSATQLIHDLDLFLEGPDGTIRTMSGVCPSDQDSCLLDSANNVERIVVTSADITAGTWTVRISAENDLIEGGPQDFALVVSLPLSVGSWAGTSSSSNTTTTTTTTTITTTTTTTSSSSSTVIRTPAPTVGLTPSPTVPGTTVGPTTTGAPALTTAEPVTVTDAPYATASPSAAATDDPFVTNGSFVTDGPAAATDAPIDVTSSPIDVSRAATLAPTKVTNEPVAPVSVGPQETPAPTLALWNETPSPIERRRDDVGETSGSAVGRFGPVGGLLGRYRHFSVAIAATSAVVLEFVGRTGY